MLSSTAASLSMYPKRMTKRTLTTEAKSWSSAQQQHDISQYSSQVSPLTSKGTNRETKHTVFSQYFTSTHQHRSRLFAVL